MRICSCNFSTGCTIISCNGKIFLFEKQRIAFKLGVAEKQRGVLFLGNAGPLPCKFRNKFSFPACSRRFCSFAAMCVMQLRVEKFAECSRRFRSPFISTSAQAGEVSGRCDLEVTLTYVSLLSCYLKGHYNATYFPHLSVSPYEKNIRDCFVKSTFCIAAYVCTFAILIPE